MHLHKHMYKSICSIYVEPKIYSYKCYFSSVAGATESEKNYDTSTANIHICAVT